jgi:predicted HTH transcriptional regulator
VPYSSLESIIEQNKGGYYLALRQTQGTIRTESPNWQPWLVFFLSSLSSQVQRLSVKVERENLLSQRLPKLSADMVAQAREHGRLTTAQAEQQTGANRATIKAHLARLVRDGHLVKQGVGRGTWYVATGQ